MNPDLCKKVSGRKIHINFLHVHYCINSHTTCSEHKHQITVFFNTWTDRHTNLPPVPCCEPVSREQHVTHTLQPHAPNLQVYNIKSYCTFNKRNFTFYLWKQRRIQGFPKEGAPVSNVVALRFKPSQPRTHLTQEDLFYLLDSDLEIGICGKRRFGDQLARNIFKGYTFVSLKSLIC